MNMRTSLYEQGLVHVVIRAHGLVQYITIALCPGCYGTDTQAGINHTMQPPLT